MRRSTRIEAAAASSKRSGRISEMIARHADQVRKDDAEEEWKPAQVDGGVDDEEEEEDNHSSDSDFSEEESPRQKVGTRASKRRLQVSSSDSSEEDVQTKTRVKQEKLPSIPGNLSKAREVMSRIRERSQQSRPGTKRPKLHQDVEEKIERIKTVKREDASDSAVSKNPAPKASSAPAKQPATSELPDAHRRPTKQHQRVPKIPESLPNAVQSSALSSSTTNNTLTHFSNEILEWNVFDALRRESLKEYDFSEANDGSEEGEVEIAKVPSQFDSYDHYFSVWKPLALEEVQAQTINSVTTDQPKAAMITATVLGSASFASKTSKVRLDFKKQSAMLPKRNPSKALLDGLYANDLVLITPDLNYFSKALSSSSSGRGKSHAKDKYGGDREDSEPPKGVLGIISSPKSSREGLIMSVLSTAWSTVDQEENLYLFKLNNLITSVREFRALCDCRDYQLMPLILSGHHKAGSMRLDSLGIEYVRWLTRSFNESQLEAITAAATSEGFTLIKGPPGTGKTTTLKGLLNSLHLREYSRYYNAVLEVARRPDHETNKAWAAIGNEKPHILVTAPSNAAVDNIVAKVIEEGFCDGEGRRYFPKIIRVGRGMSASVRSVGLEDMVDQICSQPVDVLENNILRLRYEVSNIERDAVNLREHLRQIVGWIERDPVAALAAQIQPQPPLQQAQQPQPQPPLQVLDLNSEDVQSPPPPPPLSPPPPPVSSPPGEAPPSPKWSPDPPPPPSPSTGMPASSGWSSYSSAHLEDDEDEEDEEFPTYGDSLTDVSGSFSAQESGKAFSAFLDDSSSTDEDEPLPTQMETYAPVSPVVDEPDGTETPDASDKTEDIPALPAAVESCEDNDDESDVDEPLPQPTSTEMIEPKVEDSAVTEPTRPAPPAPLAPPAPPAPPAPLTPPSQEILTVNTNSSALSVNAPNDEDVPMSPPPPPPLSPPPPPPLSPPPPPPPSDSRPSSPMVMPLSPTPQAPSATEAASGADRVEIDYTKYQEYRAVAQQINGCLEKLSEVKLELQRYEFARKMVGDRGKLSATTRQSLEVSFLDTAHIVFTTLSSAGVAALDASSRYDVLVVDEAAQAVELSTIIPMKFGSRQCVLVGDPQQLSATVFSRTGGQSLYERSLFERLETCGHPVHMLRTQYRSHPMISDFPRHYFYEGKLQDGDNVKSEGYNKPYHHLGPAFTPLVFWNLLSSRESSTKSVSRMNIGEAELAVNLYLTLKKSCPPDAVAGKVGMITPYSQQMDELRNRFRRALGDRYDSEVEINTVDGFQGREKDIIILSTVRADPRAGVGFLNDIRRMNVALTRAKFACYVIGSEATLRSSKPWSALLDHAHNSRCVVHVENPTCNLITLQPMERPSEARQTRDARKRSSSPMSHFRSSPAIGAPFGASQQPFPHLGQGGSDAAPLQGQGWRGQGRGGRPSSGDGRGRGGRRSGSQRGGRGSQGSGRGRGMADAYIPPQPYHANAVPPGGGAWHQPPAGMVPTQHPGQDPRSFVRGRGFESAPPAMQMQPAGMHGGGHIPPPPPPPPQSFYPPPPDASIPGRGGGRNPRDPRFRNNAQSFNADGRGSWSGGMNG